MQENEEKRTLKHGGTVVVNKKLIKRGGDGGKGEISKVVTKGKFIIAGGLG